jgi:hypothetical protein
MVNQGQLDIDCNPSDDWLLNWHFDQSGVINVFMVTYIAPKGILERRKMLPAKPKVLKFNITSFAFSLVDLKIDFFN